MSAGSSASSASIRAAVMSTNGIVSASSTTAWILIGLRGLEDLGADRVGVGEIEAALDPEGGDVRGDARGLMRMNSPGSARRAARREHLQIGPVTQYVTSLVKTHDEFPQPHYGLEHAGG